LGIAIRMKTREVKPRTGREGGLTLVELMVALVIATILLAGLYRLFRSTQTGYLAQNQLAELQQNARIGVDEMIREMRLAGYQAYCDPVTADAAMFEFEADTDLNGKPERIIYKLDAENNRLLRASSGDLDASIGCTSYDATAAANDLYQTVASNVTSLNFAYYDRSNGPTVDPSAVRRMTINLTVSAKKPEQGGATRSVQMTSDVKLRNEGLKR
jgi:type IV pilus assembly protein PilW